MIIDIAIRIASASNAFQAWYASIGSAGMNEQTWAPRRDRNDWAFRGLAAHSLGRSPTGVAASSPSSAPPRHLVWRKAAKHDLGSQVVVHELSERQPLQILVFDLLCALISDRMMQRVNRLQ